MSAADEVIGRFERWLRYSGKRPSTVKTYTAIARLFVEFAGGDPSEARPEIVQDFYDWLLEEGWSESSLPVVGWALRAFFRSMGRREEADWVPVPAPPERREPKWIPEDVCLRMVRGDPVLAVAYDLALRLGEVVRLRRDRWNPSTGDIEVERLKHKGRSPWYQLRLTPWVNDLLTEYVKVADPPPDRLFPLSPRAVQYRFKRALARVGLDPSEYGFHSLRHSRATHIAIRELKEKGTVDVLRLAKFLGHTNPSSTMVYVHLASRYLAFGSERPPS